MRETIDLEYKQGLSKTYLKTVSAFANYGTGKILFGVDDNGVSVGLSDPEDACLRIENSVNDNLSPVPRFTLDINEDDTVALTVHEGAAKPYLYHGKAYRRADSATVEVSRLEYGRLVLAGANTTFDALESSRQELSFEQLQKELSNKVGLKALDANALISLELVSSSGEYNNAAALLADTNQFVGTDMVRFGDSISKILSRRTFEGVSVLAQMEQALAVFDEYYAYEEVIGATRVRKSLIPREAFREAVANALVHRCWDVRANVKISMFADRIEIVSPGGLPDGITEKQYLGGGPSIARNPILANVFFRLGYIERFGTGIPRIIAAYAGLVESPLFDVDDSAITVTLPVENGTLVTADERVVLDVLETGLVLTRSEISNTISMSKDKTIKILNGLLSKRLIKRSGAGRSTRYSKPLSSR